MESWAKGWQERFRSLILRMGYEDTFTFVMSRSDESFGQMFRAVRQAGGEGDGGFLAFAHLEEMFYIDAAKRESLREAFMEALVRSLRQCLRSGWNQGKRIRERRIDAQTKWPIPHFVSDLQYSHDEWTGVQEEVWRELDRLKPPDDWCPKNFEDRIVQEAFANVWPPGCVFPVGSS